MNARQRYEAARARSARVLDRLDRASPRLRNAWGYIATWAMIDEDRARRDAGIETVDERRRNDADEAGDRKRDAMRDEARS